MSAKPQMENTIQSLTLTTTSTDEPNKNIHSLLPKHVSRLPAKSTLNEPTSTSTKLLNEEAKKPQVNSVFKSVANSANLNSCSPLGRIEIKNSSPCVRVGLSRNIKIPSLHKNVKPTLE